MSKMSCAFSFVFLSLVCYTVYNNVLLHVKDLEGEKGRSLHQQKLLSPTENTAPETPRQWPRLCDVTLRHYVKCLRYL